MFKEINYDDLIDVIESDSEESYLFTMFKLGRYSSIILYDGEYFYHLSDSFSKKLINFKEEQIKSDIEVINSLKDELVLEKELIKKDNIIKKDRMLDILSKANFYDAVFSFTPYNHHQ